ncbi:MAG: helix-turn-helix domain-containing protein [Deltaproteobacteria bacterium]|nr:helix-turn-helix domain-containing protein [Deltaproteobacteria bacterium]
MARGADTAKHRRAVAAIGQALVLLGSAIQDLQEGQQSSGDKDRPVDACTYLKDALPKRRVLSACRSGEFPAHKVGRRWLCKASDVDAWLSKQTEAAPTDAPVALARWRERRRVAS